MERNLRVLIFLSLVHLKQLKIIFKCLSLIRLKLLRKSYLKKLSTYLKSYYVISFYKS